MDPVIAGLVLLPLVGPTQGAASRSLEVLVSDDDGLCFDYFPVGALSHDGQHLLITRYCDTTGVGDWGVRGTLRLPRLVRLSGWIRAQSDQ